MIAVVTLLLAFPLGYFMRSYLAANTAYAIAYLWAFVFQAIYLMPDFLDGMLTVDEGQRVAPTDVSMAEFFPWDYGLVTLAIFMVGFGLVRAGRWTAARRGRLAAEVAPVS